MKDRACFNVRAYGILRNAQGELLVSDEFSSGKHYTKFPGGGLIYGESLPQCVIREFKEECNADVQVVQHVYTTDVFRVSFIDQSQVIAVYYLVNLKENQTITRTDQDPSNLGFRWISPEKVDQSLTFELDRLAWRSYQSNPTLTAQF